MTRKNFIKNFAALGLGSTFMGTLLASCGKRGIDLYPEFDVNFDGKVIVIGAGSAGLIAGHVLNQYNIDFQILEASSVFGGRVKKTGDFADFPIDLGAEWIHTDASILAKLLNDPTTDAEIDVIPYSPETISVWHNGKLKKRNIFSNFYGEIKFKNSTWFDFFDQHIVPGIQNKIQFNSPVKTIDYSSDQIVVTNLDGDTFEADKVIITVPLNILRSNYITFQPAFPQEKVDALEDAPMPDGMKVFMEFSERFYPDIVYTGGLNAILSETNGERIFYDAAFRKDSERNILGLFTVGELASTYTDLNTEEEVINLILNELDEMFDGKASATYQKHVIQNWSKEPFIQGSYSHYENYGALDILAEPIDNKIFFAGEAYSIDSTATVHGAGETAFDVVKTILKG